MSIFSIINSIIKGINDVEMTLLVHLLKYQLHHSEITDTITKTNAMIMSDTNYRSKYEHITTQSLHIISTSILQIIHSSNL